MKTIPKDNYKRKEGHSLIQKAVKCYLCNYAIATYLLKEHYIKCKNEHKNRNPNPHP